MGIAKTIYTESQESPWLHSSALDNKYVCANCIQDKYLRKIIKKNLENLICTYCNKKSKKNIAAPLREIISLLGCLNIPGETSIASLKYLSTSLGGMPHHSAAATGTGYIE
jgi:hypothetical protein